MSIVLMTMLALVFSAHGEEVKHFVSHLLKMYPEARLLDIYKSSFQDFMGAEHLVSDTASARAYLEHELAIISPQELSTWYYEPCGTEGRYVRVNLLTVFQGFISADTLLDAFIRSANLSNRPTVEQWIEQWHLMLCEIDSMELQLPNYQEDKQFIEDVLNERRYAISHSPEYRNAYSPHYRIIRRDIFEQDIKPLLPDHQ